MRGCVEHPGSEESSLKLFSNPASSLQTLLLHIVCLAGFLGSGVRVFFCRRFLPSQSVRTTLLWSWIFSTNSVVLSSWYKYFLFKRKKCCNNFRTQLLMWRARNDAHSYVGNKDGDPQPPLQPSSKINSIQASASTHAAPIRECAIRRRTDRHIGSLRDWFWINVDRHLCCSRVARPCFHRVSTSTLPFNKNLPSGCRHVHFLA